MVVMARIELTTVGFQPTVLPLNYITNDWYRVEDLNLEPKGHEPFVLPDYTNTIYGEP